MLLPEAPLDSPIVNQRIAHGQRVAEGQNFETRKTLWKYTQWIEMQRRIIHDWREEILFQKPHPSLPAQRSSRLSDKIRSLPEMEAVRDLQKHITLYHIDRGWSEHLENMSHIREGIHLESLGGKSPVEQFRKQAAEAFLALQPRIEESVARMSGDIQIIDGSVNMDLEKLKGPSATWTYMITDTPYGHWVEMLKGTNIGYAAGAALYAAPFLFLMGVIQRIKMRRKGSV